MKIIISATAMAAVLAISPAYAQLTSQLGILDLTANDGINPATGEAWQAGDSYRLVFISSVAVDPQNSAMNDISAWNTAVQTIANNATGHDLSSVTWNIVGSTADVDARDNTSTNPTIDGSGHAIFAMDGSSAIANNFDNLWDGTVPANRPAWTENGDNMDDVAAAVAWSLTGTNGAGTADGGLYLKDTTDSGGIRQGRNQDDHHWINANITGANWIANTAFSVYGMSEELTVSGPDISFLLTITPNAETPGSYDLEWDSQAGKLYNLRTSTDLIGAISTWTLVEGDIEATPPTNLLTVDPTDDKRFYSVEEYDAPPVFATDFETDNGDFTVSTTAGSAWEWGTPDSDNELDLMLTAGNSGTNAWGVNLGTADNGLYTNPTTTSLRSPVIDLSAFTTAELTFAEAVDFGAADAAEVYVISDSDESVIAGPIHTSSTGAIRTADWAAANDSDPVALPAAALGRAVRLEWRFTGATEAFLGWYIDDVEVTAE